MKIRSQKKEGNKVFLEIEEDYSGLEMAREKALVEAGREVKIPGFRPGKAPKELVEKAIKPEYVESQAAQNLISDLYPQIIEEAKVEPVDFPKVEILEHKKNQPFAFKMEVEVYPEVKLGKYKGLKVEKTKAEVTEDEVMKVLGNLQNRFAKTGPDGKKEEMPLDDEFAKKVSQQGTLAELKEEIRAVMLRDRVVEAEADVKNKLIAAASSESKLDVPVAMVEREVDVMLDELRASLAQSSLTLEDYFKGIKKEPKALREELKKPAEIRVKGKVVLRAVASAEKMKIQEEETEKELAAMAESSERELGEIKKSLDENAKKYIEDYMLRRKALDFLLEKAQIKEVSTKPLDPSTSSGLGAKEEKK